MTTVAIVWFRRDFRLADNPALAAGVAAADVIVPVYIHAPDEEAPWQPGAASNWWLHHSLTALSDELAKRGAPLIVRRGDSAAELQRLAEQTGAETVYWNRLHEPAILARDARVRAMLRAGGLDTHDFNAALLIDPGAVLNKKGDPYKVFTPFWKAAKQALQVRTPTASGTLNGLLSPPASLTIEELGLLPGVPWHEIFAEHWTPGEAAAHARLETFIEKTADLYETNRNRPDLTGTSRLSPYLHFGEISPHQVAWAAEQRRSEYAASGTSIDVFLSEVGWREFAHHLLVHFPHTTNEPLRADFDSFPWRMPTDDDASYVAWCKGRTGIPLVDAGMRELWHTGWMHNRVRMIVASFLTKNQLISWHAGANWFWDTLVDADLASNTLGWQWTAGCGADAAPFFRIFNPVRQGQKFDPDENYVRRWCKELENVPAGKAHEPRLADGRWPELVVDLKGSRDRALEAYKRGRK